MFKLMEDKTTVIFQVMAVMLLIGSLMTIGAANLSAIFTLMQEIIDNTDVIIGMVIMGVTIGIAIFIGSWIQKLLDRTVSGKK